MKFEKTEVFNLEGSLRGMRNPLESWDKSDSYYCSEENCNRCNMNTCIEDDGFKIGPNDLSLAGRLCGAGTEHRKFLRQIFITVDITAPIYW